MNKVLKPCPFCGGEATTEGRKIIYTYKDYYETTYEDWIVRCTNDECFMSGLQVDAFFDKFPTEEEAIKAWNHRTRRGGKA